MMRRVTALPLAARRTAGRLWGGEGNTPNPALECQSVTDQSTTTCPGFKRHRDPLSTFTGSGWREGATRAVVNEDSNGRTKSLSCRSFGATNAQHLLQQQLRRTFSAVPEAIPEDDPATDGPLALYRKRVKDGSYRPDDRQEEAIKLLQDLYVRVVEDAKKCRGGGLEATEADDDDRFANLWARLSGSKPPSEQTYTCLRGLYMYGGVGSGKTMLMDVFVECAPPSATVVRTHFHDFMLDVHKALKKYEARSNPLDIVAKDIIGKHPSPVVLCLDELMVTDVANAMILNRLFSKLWQNGLVLVSTSNRAPQELYKGGLQRDLFLPFIAKLQQNCLDFDIRSKTDYRRLARQMLNPHFFVGRGGAGREATGATKPAEKLEESFTTLSGGAQPLAVDVKVQMGRIIHVERAAGKLAHFNFRELCEEAVGASDFLALCGQFHTIAVEGIPMFSERNRPSAYRFVKLIDVMYENKVRLLASAEAEPTVLFSQVITQADMGDSKLQNFIVDDNLGFAKVRIISRMLEMQSEEYAHAHAQKHTPELVTELVKQRGLLHHHQPPPSDPN
eukprot:CAMPEP_0198200600 /NCGR_PEP_ID=MMETSP1445-20131203/3592_1 /TAXON_ID=36898 /ORGANISM="Pyramimonas sp., Strain CCMP2087" /LENGTH=561 /DNA_ID=CAMNT_0043870723 /DNA_START=95 /DNA_END=1780 /DNA_ORIENTATION=+